MLRAQLVSSLIGSITLSTDPRGLDSLEQTISRSNENDGVIFEVSLALDWAKEGRAFIQSCYSVSGIEAVIIVNIYEYDPNARQWDIYYTGKLDMAKYAVTQTLATLPITQTGFERNVINLLDVDVDLETLVSQNGSVLPVTPTVNLGYHGKRILKAYSSRPNDGLVFLQLAALTFQVPQVIIGPVTVTRDVTVFGQIDTTKVLKSELKSTFMYPYGYSTLDRFPILTADEAGVTDIDIQLRLKHTIDETHQNGGGAITITSPCANSASLGAREIKAWFEHRTIADVLITKTQIGSDFSPSGCGGGSSFMAGVFETKNYIANGVNVSVGDNIYVYFTVRVYGDYRISGGSPSPRDLDHALTVQADETQTWIKISTGTESLPSNHKTILIYEALDKMTQFYTDRTVSFKSNFFGRTDTVPAYLSDGDGSMLGLTNGRVLRNLGNLTIFANMQDTFQTMNALWCLGLGFETIGGVQKLVIEDKSYFYNKNSLIMELGVVSDIKKEVALKYYYSQIELSYPKIDGNQINGIDEFNSIRRFKAPLTQAKSKLILKPMFKGSGYEIEAQRRQQDSTKDSRNDEFIFMVMVRRFMATFHTDKNEDFTTVNNLYDPATAYNLKISPVRNLIRWAKIIAAPLWAVASKVYSFSYGEYNYAMETQLTTELSLIKEGGLVDVNNTEPIWIPEIYSFISPLTRTEFRLIKQNHYGYISFIDNLGVRMEGYILEVKHKPSDKLGNFKLLKVFRP